MSIHEHIEYVTRDELAARLAEFELRIVERINAMELRLERRMDDHFHAQTRLILGMLFSIIGLYAAVGLAAFVIAVRT
jgi:hypothetical protein